MARRIVIASSLRVGSTPPALVSDVNWTRFWSELLRQTRVVIVCRSHPANGDFAVEPLDAALTTVGAWYAIPPLLTPLRILREAVRNRRLTSFCVADEVGSFYAAVRPKASRARSVVLVQGFGTSSLTYGGRINPVVLRLAGKAFAVLRRLAILRADHVVAVSRSVASGVMKSGDEVLISPEVDWSELEQAPLPADSRDGTAAIFVGRLEIEKGVELAIHAALLAKSVDRLVIVGRGSRLSEVMVLRDRYREELEIEIVSQLTHKDVLDLLQRVRVGLVPSLSEGFGLAAFEALAMGAAVVASDVGGLAEAVAWSDRSQRLSSRDPREWADAIDTSFSGSRMKPGELERVRRDMGWNTVEEVMLRVGVG